MIHVSFLLVIREHGGHDPPEVQTHSAVKAAIKDGWKWRNVQE